MLTEHWPSAAFTLQVVTHSFYTEIPQLVADLGLSGTACNLRLPSLSSSTALLKRILPYSTHAHKSSTSDSKRQQPSDRSNDSANQTCDLIGWRSHDWTKTFITVGKITVTCWNCYSLSFEYNYHLKIFLIFWRSLVHKPHPHGEVKGSGYNTTSRFLSVCFSSLNCLCTYAWTWNFCLACSSSSAKSLR